ncbi:rolling circle replication-associated protein [Aerococcus urinaeequi]|uniref:rolling circle replication-associated protein n=1 Tax=Aerococcus urinaeequi TaxID=51665 RepID=UPI003D6BA8F5
MSKSKNELKSGLPVYLTYGQLKEHNKNQIGTYKYKIKAYNDGVYKVIEYKNERLKTNQKPTSSFGSNSDLSEDEKAIRLEESRKQNLYKTKNKLRDYARNNYFDKFWTLTFDPKKFGSSDNLRFEEMQKFLKRMTRKYGKFNYLAVPERHKSGAIHWHMMTGYFEPKLIDSGKRYKEKTIFNCPEWEYGFTNVQNVRSKKKISNYVSKYITKDLMDSPARRNKKKYWASRSLELPKTFGIKELLNLNIEPDFESDICKIYEIEKKDFEKIISMSEANS